MVVVNERVGDNRFTLLHVAVSHHYKVGDKVAELVRVLASLDLPPLPSDPAEAPLQKVSHSYNVNSVSQNLTAYIGAYNLAGVCDTHGRLPLHYALEQGACLEIIDILLTANPASTIHGTNRDGSTPLHMCIEIGSDVDIGVR